MEYSSGSVQAPIMFQIQWYLLILTPCDSNTSQSKHIWRTNFDLQSKRGLSIRTQTHVTADAAFPPVGWSCLHFSTVNTSLYFLPTTPVNAAFYFGHWQTYLLMKIYLTLQTTKQGATLVGQDQFFSRYFLKWLLHI